MMYSMKGGSKDSIKLYTDDLNQSYSAHTRANL